jgi:hypothetical protein
MTTLVISSIYPSSSGSAMRGLMGGSAEVTETGSWAEVTTFTDAAEASVPLTAILNGGAAVLDVSADVAMRVLVGPADLTVTGGVRGWRVNAGSSLSLAIVPGDRIWVRTA